MLFQDKAGRIFQGPWIEEENIVKSKLDPNDYVPIIAPADQTPVRVSGFQEQLQISRRARVRRFFSRDGEPLSDDDADFILRSPQAVHVDQMMKYTAVGTPAEYLDTFATRADADELMIVFQGSTVDVRVHALELVAEASHPGAEDLADAVGREERGR